MLSFYSAACNSCQFYWMHHVLIYVHFMKSICDSFSFKMQMKSILFCRQYGYLLPVDKSDVIYCSVRFSFISDHLFTYPMICLRSRHAQILPRCDGASIVRVGERAGQQNGVHVESCLNAADNFTLRCECPLRKSCSKPPFSEWPSLLKARTNLFKLYRSLRP